MHDRYRHTQIGWLTLGLLAGVAVPAALMMVVTEVWWVLGVTCGVLVVIGALTHSLTVEVDGHALTARFGVGLIRRTVPWASVQSYRAVRNPWYFGWGLRWLPNGWLWNVSGFHAVELTLTSGRVFRVGTDQPAALCAAIAARVPELPQQPGPEGPAASSRLWMLGFLGVVVIPLFGAVALLWITAQPIGTSVTEDGLVIRSTPYGGTVARADVRTVELVERLPAIRTRTNGYAAGGTLRGWFRLEELGPAKLFVEVTHPPFLVVHTTGSVVVLNHEDPAQTRALYEAIRAW